MDEDEEPFTVEGYIAKLQARAAAAQQAAAAAQQAAAADLCKLYDEREAIAHWRPDDLPWVVEPEGDDVAYMVRFNTPRNTGYQGFKWPEEGYVECDNYLDWTCPEKDAGLAGFLHGEGNYRVVIGPFFRGALKPAPMAVVAVRLNDVRKFTNWRDPESDRAWRGWVKYTGPYAQVCAWLRSEGEYGAMVADTVETGLRKADAAYPRMPLTDLVNNFIQDRYVRGDIIQNASPERAEKIHRNSRVAMRIAFSLDKLGEARRGQ